MKNVEIGFPLELSGDAEYHPGYFYISVPFKVPSSIKEFTNVELGTLIHEYTHYLQNISTLWGLYENVALYGDMCNVIGRVLQDTYPILDIPLTEDYLDRDKLFFQKIALGRGSDITAEGHNVSHLKIAEPANFKYEIVFPLDDKKIAKTLISFDTDAHGRQMIMFGAWYLKEAMAAIIQRRVDPTADERHHDLPYKLVERFVSECFQSVSADEDKLLAICYLSLFSMYPGEEFIKLCTDEEEHPAKSYKVIVERFFNEGAKLKLGKVPYQDVLEHYRTVLMSIISTLINDSPKYLSKVIDDEISNSRLLALILTKDIDKEGVDRMVKDFGMPIIIGTHDTSLIPGIGSMYDSIEIIGLIGYGTCYKYLTKGVCPQIQQCKEVEGRVNHNCQNTPWNREDDCPLKLMATAIGISSKNIINRYRSDEI